MKIKDKIITEIKKIYDPEIPVNIYDLGLIYNIEIKNDNEAYIEMTLLVLTVLSQTAYQKW